MDENRNARIPGLSRWVLEALCHRRGPETWNRHRAYPRTFAKDTASAEKLKKRTLTNLYNESPAWLKAAHAKLDEAVFVAYGWPADISDDDLLAKLLELNLSRAAAGGSASPSDDDAD